METHEFDRITADQLTHIRSVDFARLVALESKYLGGPDSSLYAQRNFSQFYPRSMHLDLIHKAAVAVTTTADMAWAGPVRPLAEGFIQLVRESSLIGKLGLRRIPLTTGFIPVETTGAVFTWIGQGVPKAFSAGAYGTVTLPYAKASGIMTFSDEVLKLQVPGSDVALRDAMVKGATVFVDTEFTDQTVASTAARPGGLANGSPTAAASGTTAAAALTDLKAAVNAFILVNPSLEDARMVMAPNVAIAVAIATNSTTLFATGGSLWGIPVATTAAIGNKILLFDASQVIYGDDPAGVTIDVSRQATPMMDSAPSDPSVASDVFTSLWQQNKVAIRAEYPVRWKLARTDAARTITGVAYA